MTLEDYRSAWQRHEGREVDGPDEALVDWVARRAEDFESRIRRRDLLETLACVVVVVLFGYETATASPLLAKGGAAVVVAGALLVVWRLRRARRAFGADAAGRPVAERLRVQREKVDAQIDLLESVLWWYVSPLALGVGLFLVGKGGTSWGTAASLAVLVAVSVAVWWLNRRVVRRDLRPRRKELTRRLRQLEEAEEGGTRRPGADPGDGGPGPGSSDARRGGTGRN